MNEEQLDHPRTDDRNDELDESPVPDPEQEQDSEAEDVPEAEDQHGREDRARHLDGDVPPVVGLAHLGRENGMALRLQLA